MGKAHGKTGVVLAGMSRRLAPPEPARRGQTIGQHIDMERDGKRLDKLEHTISLLCGLINSPSAFREVLASVATTDDRAKMAKHKEG